ncbi:MAG TPA: hypothetical protein VLG71_01650, partial [Candidatus Limnocylindria bacterium]|nr:hypothetical protein [Candidatus Limnocylindria bacterium]
MNISKIMLPFVLLSSYFSLQAADVRVAHRPPAPTYTFRSLNLFTPTKKETEKRPKVAEKRPEEPLVLRRTDSCRREMRDVGKTDIAKQEWSLKAATHVTAVAQRVNTYLERSAITTPDRNSLWLTKRIVCAQKLQQPEGYTPSSLDWSSDSKLAVGYTNGHVRVLSREGKLVAEGNEMHGDPVVCVRWAPDAARFASQSNNSHILVRAPDGQFKALLNDTFALNKDNDTNNPIHIMWLNATKILANIRKSGGCCEDIGIWDTESTPLFIDGIQTLNPGTIIQSTHLVRALSTVGTTLVTTPRSDPGNYALQSPTGAKIVSAHSRHAKGINDISFSACSKLMALAGNQDGQVSVWHADGVPHARCSVRHTVSGTSYPVNFTCVRWIAERQAFVASGQDG